MSLRFRWISKCNSKAHEILDSQEIIFKDISELPGPGTICKFDYTINVKHTTEKEIRKAIEEIELEPTFIYVLDVLEDVSDMKTIILTHSKTIYPFIVDLISYTFEDGTMFIPLGKLLSNEIPTRIYIDLNLPDYRPYRGMIPIPDTSNLTRYSLHSRGYHNTVKLGKIYLLKDITTVEDIMYMNRSLKVNGYFAIDVETSQDMQLYTELAGLWGCDIIMKESDYICLKADKESEFLNYMPSYEEFFESVRDMFPVPPKFLIEDSSLEFQSLYSLRFFLQSGEIPPLPTPLPPANLEISIYKEEGKTKLEVYQNEIYDTTYYDDTPENVEKAWLKGELFTDMCRTTLTELGRISFYCLLRELI